jgi:hypothetical protein
VRRLQFYGAWWNREAEKVVFITELMSSGTCAVLTLLLPLQ